MGIACRLFFYLFCCFVLLTLSACSKSTGYNKQFIFNQHDVNANSLVEPIRFNSGLGEFELYGINTSPSGRSGIAESLTTPMVEIKMSLANSSQLMVTVVTSSTFGNSALFRIICPDNISLQNSKSGFNESEAIYLAIQHNEYTDFGVALIGGGVIEKGTIIAKLIFSSRYVNSQKFSRTRNVPNNDNGRISDLIFQPESDNLAWSYRNTGDYNQDGEVSIPDITPIAQYYQEIVEISNPNYNQVEVIDGDLTGEVGISDITPIAINYLNDISRYKILCQPDDSGGPQEWFIQQIVSSSPENGRRRYSFEVAVKPDGNYSVFPVDSNGIAGSQSNVVSVNRSAGNPPEIPTGLTIGNITSSSIALSWDAMPLHGNEFRLYKSLNADMSDQVCITPSGFTSQGFTASGLAPETPYYFKLSASNDFGETYCDVVSATTLAVSTNEYDWLVMVYIGGDNDLYEQAIDDIDEMEMIGSTDSVAIAVQVESWYEEIPFPMTKDRRISNLENVHRFKIVQDSTLGTIITDGYLNNESFPHVGYDSADPANIADFVDWATTEFQATNTCLILWDHGLGWEPGTERATSWIISDETEYTEGDNYLIGQALVPFDLDVLMMDGCVMAGIEILDAYYESADLITFSEAVVPWDGFPYDVQLQWLNENSSAVPIDVSTNFASMFVLEYAELNESSVTMSVVDTSKYIPLKDSITTFVNTLGDPVPDVERDLLLIAAENSFDFNIQDKDINELFGKYVEYGAGAEYLSSINDIFDAVDDAVVYSGAFNCVTDWVNVETATGLTICLPFSPMYYQSIQDSYGKVQFTTDTGWYDFLNRLHDITPPDTAGGFHVELTWEGTVDALDLVTWEPDSTGEPWYYFVYEESSLNGIFGLDSLDSGEQVEKWKANDLVYGGTYSFLAFYNDLDGFATATLKVYDAEDALIQSVEDIVIDNDSWSDELGEFSYKFCDILIPLP